MLQYDKAYGRVLPTHQAAEQGSTGLLFGWSGLVLTVVAVGVDQHDVVVPVDLRSHVLKGAGRLVGHFCKVGRQRWQEHDISVQT